MKRTRLAFALVALFVTSALAQNRPAPGKADVAPKPAGKELSKPVATEAVPSVDYKREPYVIEQVITKMRFENDGTGRHEVTARIKVQDESGVEQLGQLVWGYNSGNERMDVNYVRVRKADGSTVTAGPDAVQDLSGPISREAPMYTDYRQKHITVPGLRPGETLEYQYTLVLHTPLASGQFWAEHNFADGPIVLDEQVEINVPAARALKLKTKPGYDARISDQGDRRIYRWNSSHLTRDEDENNPHKHSGTKKKQSDADARPDLELTTFATWDEVGRWYAQLERERRITTPDLQAKANALVAGHATDLEKLEALYDYVAKNFRYVSLSFGSGRYQPHAAADVFANQYGDCKDKNTLLAALLSAAGFQSNSVLINASRKIDPEVPSPAQFNHVITYVPLGKEAVWLDTTTEIAPFRMLSYQLRDKQALLVEQSGTSRLERTPADPPFPNMQRMEAEGQISALGKLTLHSKETIRGDLELGLRSIFRRLPETRWKDLLQVGATANGIQGEITDYKISDPAATREPMQIEYTISQANYLDWANKKSTLKLPVAEVMLQEFDEDSSDPLKLNVKTNSEQHVRLEFPPKFTIHLPLPVSVKRDYADYSSTYKLEGQTLTVERHFAMRVSELPLARLSDYNAFRRAVLADSAQKVSVEGEGTGTPEIPQAAKADDLYEAGIAAFNQRKYPVAVDLFKRTVALEPRHKFAWNELGRVHLAMNDLPPAAEAFKQAIAVNPYEEFAYNNLGRVYWRQKNYKDATQAFQKQIEVNPLDKFAHKNLAEMYMEMKQYADALPELEKAASITSDDSMVQIELGRAYLNLEQKDKALAAFDRAIELAPSPGAWNGVAYEMAQKSVDLDRALQYADSAVSSTTTMLRNISPSAPPIQLEYLVSTLTASWDTLGWVYFRQGDLAKAEKYIKVSWELSQNGEVGDHLGQIYEKMGNKEKAIHAYKLALATLNPPVDTRGRLQALTGDKGLDAAVNSARAELTQARTLKLGGLLKESASAEFHFTFAPGAKTSGGTASPAAPDSSSISAPRPSGAHVEEVRFVSGSDKLKPFAENLRALEPDFSFPDDTPTRIFRRGILSCSKLVEGCTFVFLTTDAGYAADAQEQMAGEKPPLE